MDGGTTLRDSIKKMEQIEYMSYNWNGNGAQPLSREVIQYGKEILNILSIQPEIFPTATNSIQFEYDKDNGDYLEFNIYDDRIDIFQITDKIEHNSTLNIYQKDDLQKVLSQFYE